MQSLEMTTRTAASERAAHMVEAAEETLQSATAWLVQNSSPERAVIVAALAARFIREEVTANG